MVVLRVESYFPCWRIILECFVDIDSCFKSHWFISVWFGVVWVLRKWAKYEPRVKLAIRVNFAASSASVIAFGFSITLDSFVTVGAFKSVNALWLNNISIAIATLWGRANFTGFQLPNGVVSMTGC